MPKFFLKGAGMGALIVGVPFALLGAITYDPKNFQDPDERVIPHVQNTFDAALRGFEYGALIGGAVGGPTGAVIRAFFKTEDN